MVFYKDKTIHDIQYKKPNTIIVKNSWGHISQQDIEPDQKAQPHHIEQPNQIEQDREIQGGKMI